MWLRMYLIQIKRTSTSRENVCPESPLVVALFLDAHYTRSVYVYGDACAPFTYACGHVSPSSQTSPERGADVKRECVRLKMSADADMGCTSVGIFAIRYDRVYMVSVFINVVTLPGANESAL